MFTENVQTIMGNKANFTCQVSGTQITLHWEILGRSGKYQDCTDPTFCVRSISETNFVNSTFEIDTTQLDATGITVHCVVQQNFRAQTIIRSSTGELTLQDVPPDVLASSSDNLTVDSDIGKPLLVASISGDQVTLFAMVITGSCPTVQWRVNASNISESDAHYTIGDPCPSISSFNVSSYNFTLTITVTPMTAGTYTAILSNQAGTIEVPDVFVTPPVPVVITELQLSHSSSCLVDGGSVILVCVHSGFPRPEIIFFRGMEQITPGFGSFTNFKQVSFDTVNVTVTQQEDDRVFVCVARRGSTELSQSQPYRFVFCNRSEDHSHSLPILPAILVPACAVLLLLTVGAAIAILYVRKRRQRVAVNSMNKVEMKSPNRVDTETDNSESVNLVEVLPRKMIISSGMLQLLGNIGQGEFGLVFKAHLKWHKKAETEVVAVKTMKDVVTPNDIHNLKEEVLKMQSFNHPNVMSLIGVCENFCGGPAVVMPFMANGSILDYLRRERRNLMLDGEAEGSMISCAQSVLLDMCLQIAKGMEYLADQRVVHRDLAARNCMIDANGVIKVANFGLAEDIYTTNYYRWKKGDTNVKLPVRWMSPESTQDGIFTEKSDVWSFGVTSWEVFSGGTVPYGGISPMALLQFLRDGERLSKPSNSACSNEIYSLLLQCWEEQPEERPHFSGLVITIATMLEAVGGYLVLNDTNNKTFASDTHFMYYN